MEAANPLCRWLLLAVGLIAVIGCQSDAIGSKARGQLPTEPIGPIAPPPPSGGPSSSYTPIAPIAPTAPAVSGAPVGATGVVPAIPGAVTGLPVSPSDKGTVENVGFTSAKPAVPVADLLKLGVPRVKVVAVVGANNVITDQEVMESVWQQNVVLSRLDGRAREIKQKELYTLALRKTIERELILDEMYSRLKKANKSVIIEDIKEKSTQSTDQRIRDIRKEFGLKTDEEFNTWLRVQALTLPVLRRQIERQFMSQEYVNSMLKEKGRRVGLTEIRDYYDKHPDQFKTPDKVKWQHIFISFGNPPNPQGAYARIEALRQKVAAGEDFAALSMQFDEGLAQRQKGFGTGERRSGNDTKPEDWVQPADLESTVWSLKSGQTSGIIQTQTGYHLVKVVERDHAGVRPFDSKVQGQIRDKLNSAIFEVEEKKLIEELWRKGTVIFPE
jgi:parvulin-like peptidyl-prolyl isomerase